jgi:hypothetical protein
MVAVGFASFFSSFVYCQHLVHVSPITPNALSRQFCQLNEHGHLFYVTHKQYWLSHTLLIGGWALIVLAGLLNFRWKVVRKLIRDGWRFPT